MHVELVELPHKGCSCHESRLCLVGRVFTRAELSRGSSFLWVELSQGSTCLVGRVVRVELSQGSSIKL